MSASLPPLLALAAGRRARPRLPKNSGAAPPDRNAEARIQASIVEWVRTVAPDLICFHPANGGHRSAAEAARFKWIGVLAGIPDLIAISRDGQCYCIEVKAPGGSLSMEQRAVRDRLIAMRAPYVVARSVDDVRQAFQIWGVPTRERVR